MSDHDIQIPGAFGASSAATDHHHDAFVLFLFLFCFFGLFGPSFVSCIVVFIGDLWLGLSRERERERLTDSLCVR
jgi:hypothetical protein